MYIKILLFYISDYSTGDEWEKDFELEINDLKNQANSLQTDSQKEVSRLFYHIGYYFFLFYFFC